MATAKEKVQNLIDKNPVIVFSKSYCPYCRHAKQTLDALNAKYTLVELDLESDGAPMQDELEEITGQRTVPNVIIKGKYIGGNTDIQDKHRSGNLKALLQDADAIMA